MFLNGQSPTFSLAPPFYAVSDACPAQQRRSAGSGCTRKRATLDWRPTFLGSSRWFAILVLSLQTVLQPPLHAFSHFCSARQGYLPSFSHSLAVSLVHLSIFYAAMCDVFDFLPTLSDARTRGHRQTQSILLLLCLFEAVIPSDATGDAPTSRGYSHAVPRPTTSSSCLCMFDAASDAASDTAAPACAGFTLQLLVRPSHVHVP